MYTLILLTAVGFVAFLLIAIFLKRPAPSKLALSLSLRQKISRIDFTGAFLLIAAFVCLLLALQWGGTAIVWSDSRVWGCLLGFGLIMVSFIVLQVRLKDRLVFCPSLPPLLSQS